jgi:branched-subunit amino acid transport protein
MEKLLIIVILMALVTYIPRVIPIAFLSGKELPLFIKNFLYYIPFAVLGALIFPEILYSTDSISSAAAGLVTALVLGLLRLNVIIVVFGSIIGVLVFQLI